MGDFAQRNQASFPGGASKGPRSSHPEPRQTALLFTFPPILAPLLLVFAVRDRPSRLRLSPSDIPFLHFKFGVFSVGVSSLAYQDRFVGATVSQATPEADPAPGRASQSIWPSTPRNQGDEGNIAGTIGSRQRIGPDLHQPD